MALRRCTRPVDGTIPVPALLYNDEEIHASQDGVGIYDGYVSQLVVIARINSAMNNAVRRNPLTTNLVLCTSHHTDYST